MGKRLTARNDFGVVYVGKHRKTPDMDVAGGMKVAACREVMDRLAEYEDTGLTPEEIAGVGQYVTETVRNVVETIAALAPQVAETVRETLRNATPEQLEKLLQASLLKN